MSKKFDAQHRKNAEEYLSASEFFSELGFDLYAQDINDWTWLSQLIPGIVVTSAGGIVPFQAEGLLHGLPFYYRERSGWASLSIAGANEPNAYGNTNLYHAGEEVEEFRSGPGWVSTLLNLVENLERSPFLYHFEGRDTQTTGEGDEMEVHTLNAPKTYWGWGHTPEEAFEDTKEISSYLSEHGYSEDFQREMWDAKRIYPMHTNDDDRIFPDPEPVFAVFVPNSWRDETGRIEVPMRMFVVDANDAIEEEDE
jgi:hypothetical protein